MARSSLTPSKPTLPVLSLSTWKGRIRFFRGEFDGELSSQSKRRGTHLGPVILEDPELGVRQCDSFD